MGNNLKICCTVFIALLIFFLPLKSNSQVRLKIDTNKVSVGDTLKMEVHNYSKKTGHYNIAWEVLVNKKWGMMRTDIFNDFPMAMIFQKIASNDSCKRTFIIDTIFTGTIKKYKQLPSRLVLTYSYADELEPRHIIY